MVQFEVQENPRTERKVRFGVHKIIGKNRTEPNFYNPRWKVVATTNLLTMCHTGTCVQCSSLLEHLLIANHTGEMCAHPANLPKMLDHAWPATMGNICEDVTSPLLGEIKNPNHVIMDRDNE